MMGVINSEDEINALYLALFKKFLSKKCLSKIGHQIKVVDWERFLIMILRVKMN